MREMLTLGVQRSVPGGHFVGDAAAEITVLRKVLLPVAPTEMPNAVTVIRDKGR